MPRQSLPRHSAEEMDLRISRLQGRQFRTIADHDLRAWGDQTEEARQVFFRRDASDIEQDRPGQVREGA